MSTIITIFILLVTTISMSLLYIIAGRSMTSMMKQSQIENLNTSLTAQTSIINEYVTHQEDLLTAFSENSVVRDFLKNPKDAQKKKLA